MLWLLCETEYLEDKDIYTFIRQRHIKLIKSDRKDISIVTIDLDFY